MFVFEYFVVAICVMVLGGSFFIIIKSAFFDDGGFPYAMEAGEKQESSALKKIEDKPGISIAGFTWGGIPDGMSGEKRFIGCHGCGHRSFNWSDIHNQYCPNCNKFHFRRPEKIKETDDE